MNASEFVCSEEIAKDNLDELLDYYDINKDDIEIEEGPEAMQTLLNGLVRAIRKGRLKIEINEGDLTVVQSLKFPPGDISEITYGVVNQKARMEMDKIKDNKAQERMLAFMASLSGCTSKVLVGFKGVDMGTMNRLATVFSMV